ncbi:unnamed protein product [Ixodes persulcatus]
MSLTILTILLTSPLLSWNEIVDRCLIAESRAFHDEKILPRDVI